MGKSFDPIELVSGMRGAELCHLQDREGDVKKLKVHRKFWEFSHVYA